MEIKDLLLTPIYLCIIYAFIYWVRPKVTNEYTKSIFIKAINLKIIGAISVGLIYQFYYGWGDTFNYFLSSKTLANYAFTNPGNFLEIIMFKGGAKNTPAYAFASNMWGFYSDGSFFVIRIASLLNLLTFHTYAATAILFSLLSFSGLFAVYNTFIKIYPNLYKEFAVAFFYIPSVFFWGSGLMKDTLCIGAIGWAIYGFYNVFIQKKKVITSLIIIILSILLLNKVKTYIVLCFLPACILWVFTQNAKKIKTTLVRVLILPGFIFAAIYISFTTVTTLTEGNEKYSIEKLAETAVTTNKYLERVSGNVAGLKNRTGSGYDMDFDGTTESTITNAPVAIYVTLFRPYIFEAKNPVMLVSAMEATWFLVFTLFMIFKTGIFNLIKGIISNPLVVFCLVFSLFFAIGVGLTSGNFGTLSRYKIPIMPFYIVALYVLKYEGLDKKRLETRKVINFEQILSN